MVFSILRTAAQIAILVALGNFSLYLMTGILCSVLCSFSLSRRAGRMYPFLREKIFYKLPDEEWKAMEPVFQTAFFFAQWIYGIAAICMYELFQPFIELSFGPRFLLDSTVVCVPCLLFFYHGLRTAIGNFWYALGMFQLDQYKALAEAALNLIISIILGRRIGVTGVFLGTLFSALLTSAWLDPLFVFSLLPEKIGAAVRPPVCRVSDRPGLGLGCGARSVRPGLRFAAVGYGRAAGNLRRGGRRTAFGGVLPAAGAQESSVGAAHGCEKNIQCLRTGRGKK